MPSIMRIFQSETTITTPPLVALQNSNPPKELPHQAPKLIQLRSVGSGPEDFETVREPGGGGERDPRVPPPTQSLSWSVRPRAVSVQVVMTILPSSESRIVTAQRLDASARNNENFSNCPADRHSAARRTSGAASRTSASTCFSYLVKLFWNMPTSLRAVASNPALSFQVFIG